MAGKGASDFHERGFDTETRLKLRIFRAYIREWLPVFLSDGSRRCVNVFDFFAGPGADALGNMGSPLIILDETRRYYLTHPVSSAVTLGLYFNDKDQEHAAQLRQRVGSPKTQERWSIRVTSLDFSEALAEHFPLISSKHSANLVILDQFGYKHMPPEVLCRLALCSATDLICFIPSSYVRRFARAEAPQRYLQVSPDDVSSVSARDAHRFVCDHYRRCLPPQTEYYLAPFSIRDHANVYGLIFGSGCLYGLEKFLRVCWREDGITGEANFAIDGDPVADPDGVLFPEYRVPKKRMEFEANLLEYLIGAHRTNRDVYRFSLENGFLPKHANEVLRSLQNTGRLLVQGDQGPARKGSYYVSWKHYQENRPRVTIFCRG